MSRDACEVFLFSGRSVEAEDFCQFVVERINDGDITTALQLCCISYQMFLGRNIRDAISSTPDPRTLGDTFERMNKCASYTDEKTKFLSVCDKWYKVLEPQGLMDVEHRELLRKRIKEQQYADPEDSVVSMMIEKCLKAKQENIQCKEGKDEAMNANNNNSSISKSSSGSSRSNNNNTNNNNSNNKNRCICIRTRNQRKPKFESGNRTRGADFLNRNNEEVGRNKRNNFCYKLYHRMSKLKESKKQKMETMKRCSGRGENYEETLKCEETQTKRKKWKIKRKKILSYILE